MGNGQGLKTVFLSNGSGFAFHIPKVKDPFTWAGMFAPTYGIDKKVIRLTRDVGHTLFKLKVIGRETAWDIVDGYPDKLIKLDRRLERMRVWAAEKARKPKKIKQKKRPTWDKSAQYKPSMKGSSYKGKKL